MCVFTWLCIPSILDIEMFPRLNKALLYLTSYLVLDHFWLAVFHTARLNCIVFKAKRHLVFTLTYPTKIVLSASGGKQRKYDKTSVNNCFQWHPDYNYDCVISYTVCLLPPLSSTAARAVGDDRDTALSLVGQVCHEVFQSENKRKTERKLFIREHQLQRCFLLSASLSSLPSSELLFHLFFCSFFSLRQFPSLSTSLARYPLSSSSRLCLLPSQISSSLAWNMNILELRSLKGTMKWPPS